MNLGKYYLPKSLLRATVVCFFIQVVAIGIFHTYRFRATDNNFAFGWEMGCIGRSLALGRGFQDPFCVPSGPSAWEPPVYPYLIGAVFKLFGIYSVVSAWSLLALNSLFAALTCIPIYFIAKKMSGERLARISAWTWALLPYTWYWSIHWVWDTTLSPLLLCLVILLAFDLATSRSWTGWTLFGVLWGLTALTNPSLISFLPFCGLWIWYVRRKRHLVSLGGVIAASIVFFLCIAPWQLRNQRTFHQFVFIRDNFGHELRLGNGPAAVGISTVHDQPNLSPTELVRFQFLGELEFARSRGREALAFIRQNPARTLALDAVKLTYFWAGIPKRDNGLIVGILRNSFFLLSSVLALGGLARAIQQKIFGASLLGWLILVYPLTYYIVYPHARYRHPIEPEMIILIVFLILDLGHKFRPTMNAVQSCVESSRTLFNQNPLGYLPSEHRSSQNHPNGVQHVFFTPAS